MELLREINANISYSILFSIIAFFSFIIVYALDIENSFPTMMAAFIYSHFILTLLMIAKRSHVLFEKEYQNDP